MSATEIEVGDAVVVLNVYGLRVEGVVQDITDDSGTPMYRVVSKDFALLVTKRQILEVRKASRRNEKL
jgi:hypothetical protein